MPGSAATATPRPPPASEAPTSESQPGPEALARALDGATTLPPAARQVARFIAENGPIVLASSAADLARRIGTSDATVVRAVQAMGFPGMAALRRAIADGLTGPQPSAALAMRTTLAEAGAEAERAVALAIDTQAEAVAALADPAARASLVAAVELLHPARRILVFGIGPSAALANYLATMLRRGGRTARALDATGIGLADQLLDLGAGDALLVLAYGRAYREVVAVFAEARRLDLPLVLVTDSLDPRLARQARVVVPARRGRARRVALHGATLVALEAIALGLAAASGERAVAVLEQLNALRAGISGARLDVG